MKWGVAITCCSTHEVDSSLRTVFWSSISKSILFFALGKMILILLWAANIFPILWFFIDLPLLSVISFMYGGWAAMGFSYPGFFVLNFVGLSAIAIKMLKMSVLKYSILLSCLRRLVVFVILWPRFSWLFVCNWERW